MDRVGVSGRVQVDFLDLSGKVLCTVVTNRVMSRGLRWMRDRILGGGTGSPVTFMAIGDGNTAVTADDASLVHETARMSLETTPVGDELVAGSPAANYTAFFDVGTGTGNVSELGLFLGDASMIARTVIPLQAKSSTTSIRIKWTITLKIA